MKPYTYNPKARLEADAAAAYYHRKGGAESSAKVLDELAFVIEEIRCGPHRWPFEKVAKVQRLHFRRFPYTVYYQEDLHEIYILAVAHNSRRPRYWKSRMAVD